MLQISALLDIQRWLTLYNTARLNDQKELHDRLSDLLANQNKLAETLSEFIF